MLSNAQRKSNDKYIKNNYKKISVAWPNSFAAALSAAQQASGESLAGYIRKAIEERMERDGFKPTTKEGATTDA